MTPYIEYPQLLGVLLRMLNEGEGSHHVRREVLKVSLYCHPTTTLELIRTHSPVNCLFSEDSGGKLLEHSR